MFTVESSSFRGIKKNAHACRRSWNCCYYEQGTFGWIFHTNCFINSPLCCGVVSNKLYFDCFLKHRWRIVIMTEMAPIGYVGISPKCILGFNKVMAILNRSAYWTFMFSLIFCPLLTLIFAESWRGGIFAS